MGAFAEVKREWRHFRDDEPGERFCNHRERMKHKPRSHSLIALVVGIVLLAAGVVLLFIPGPGSLFIVFGLAMVASHSERLASRLDRAEPRVRAWFRRLERKLKGSATRK